MRTSTAILDLPFAPPSIEGFSGRRETNNSSRTFFNAENQAKFPVVRRIANAFKDEHVIDTIERTTRADLTDTRLRIEYCQDAPGFWLEPHTDISVKKFTMLVYLSGDPALRLAGTDIHEGPPDHTYVTTATPTGATSASSSFRAKNTWHGVGHHPLTGLRRSLIINYVTAGWRDTFELA
ncbi:MAG: 2OG-Fe(II) oxygenase [Hyphomicrobium sp.]